MGAADLTRLGRASPLIRGRVAAKDPARGAGFVERTTLFVVALKKAQAIELLDGFAEPLRQRSRVFAQQLSDLDSPTRQARLAIEFGVRDGARERIKALLDQSPLALRAALMSQLPSTLRPEGAPAAPTASPALQALAARLVREATR
ncbi:MAG: hypothetical protein IAE78_19740 [Myxococcus sp.]|nr:hypothetical protein [Myxococcus sp.]